MKQITKKQSGFTLIEVVLVLAIGALIILMAILAFNGASRSRRDTARANLAGTIQSAVEQSASNNNGQYPDATAFVNLRNQSGWADPRRGVNGVTAGNAVPAAGTPGIVYVVGGTCTNATTLGAIDATSTTQYAVVYRQEGGNATACRSN